MGGVQKHCPGMQGKAKAQLDLNLVRNVKNIFVGTLSARLTAELDG